MGNISTMPLLFLCLDCFFESLAQLIRTRCWTTVAADVFDSFDDILGLLSDNEFRDALKVAVATTDEIALLDDIVVVESHMNESGTSADSLIIDFFHLFI